MGGKYFSVLPPSLPFKFVAISIIVNDVYRYRTSQIRSNLVQSTIYLHIMFYIDSWFLNNCLIYLNIFEFAFDTGYFSIRNIIWLYWVFVIINQLADGLHVFTNHIMGLTLYDSDCYIWKCSSSNKSVAVFSWLPTHTITFLFE